MMNEIDSGTQFDFTYAPGTSMEQIIGFEMAGEIWSSYLKDDVAVRLYVESTDQLPENVVGAALPGKKQEVDYKKLWKEMARDIRSDNDILAFNNLPGNKEFNVIAQGQQIGKTKDIKLTNANAKALDLLEDKEDELDGYILVNDLTGGSAAGWDYDALRNEDISSNNLDFVSVAMHEIGHVLGFVSGIDDEGWLDVLSEANEKAVKDNKPIELKDFKFATPLDLYRYTSDSAAVGELDLSLGGDPFFSIDGGNTRLGNFANGEYTNYGGDGYQASHWQQDSSQGIMNPILPMGERRGISDLDVTAMDVIGWNINTSEAPSWQEMYDTAVANSYSAMIRDRSEDVEEMIEDSQYKGRSSSKSSYSSYSSWSKNYSFQMGYWQYTTFDAVDTSDAIIEESTIEAELGTDVTIDESAIVTELDSDISVDESLIVDELDSNTVTEVFPDLEVDNNESLTTEFTENNDDTLDIAGVSTGEQNEDFLSSEEVPEETASDDILYYQSPLLPGLLIPIEFY